jgi:hypothetical protein
MGACAGGGASNAGGRMVLIGGSLPAAFAGGALLPFREEGETVAAKGSAGGWLVGARRWPHVTQKRRLRGFRWPQRGHGDGSCPVAASPVADGGASPSRSSGATKLTSGAGGRCGTRDGGRGGCDARGSATDAGAWVGPERPMTGVAGAPRAARR